MRQLLVLRHARPVPGGAVDFARPLDERGRADAAAMGRVLAERGVRPQVVLASPAARVVQTLESLLPPAGVTEPPRYDQDLYCADVGVLVEALRALDEGCACALLAGHNPGIAELIGQLTDEPAPAVSPGTLACLRLGDDVAWSDVRRGAAVLEWIASPA